MEFNKFDSLQESKCGESICFEVTKKMMSKFEQIDFANVILVDKLEKQQTEEKELMKRNIHSICDRRSLYVTQWHNMDNKWAALNHDDEKNEKEMIDLVVLKNRLSKMIKDLNEEFIGLHQRLGVNTQLKFVKDAVDYYGQMQNSYGSLQNYSLEAYKILIEHNDNLRKANIEVVESIEALRNRLEFHTLKVHQERLEYNINMN